MLLRTDKKRKRKHEQLQSINSHREETSETQFVKDNAAMKGRGEKMN